MKLSELSIMEKISQKFILGVNSQNLDIITYMIKKYAIGGVILYKKNYSSYEDMIRVINTLKEANMGNKVPLFISIDQEGGRVNRMPFELKNIKNIYDMSCKDLDLIYENADLTGQMLSSLGINMNFAPVLDICDNSSSKLLYKRCFYGDIKNVEIAGLKYINGLYNHNIISVCKHFPVHGVSKMDSHFFVPCVFNKENVINRHIKPFETVINEGIDALMVGHLVIKGMTKGVPASISSHFLNKYLRDRYKYDGMIITDEINMLSRSLIYQFGYLKKAFLSGSDIILMKMTNNDKNIIDKCFKWVCSNNSYLEDLDKSVARILRVKKKYKITDKLISNKLNISNFNKKIDDLNSMVD